MEKPYKDHEKLLENVPFDVMGKVAQFATPLPVYSAIDIKKLYGWVFWYFEFAPPTSHLQYWGFDTQLEHVPPKL